MMLNGCSTPGCQQWQFDTILTPYSCYNSGRLTLLPADLKSVSLELVRGVSGERLYVNTLSLSFPCDLNNSSKCQLTFAIDEVNYSVSADRLQGGQRLLLPQAATQQIIEALLENKSVQMTVGRYHVVIISTSFPELYKKLSTIPIDIKFN